MNQNDFNGQNSYPGNGAPSYGNGGDRTVNSTPNPNPNPNFTWSGAQPQYQQPQYQQPQYQQPQYQQPQYQQPPMYQPVDVTTFSTPDDVQQYANSAFKKGLASLIMSEFPITSIIAIILGKSGLNSASKASELASYYGIGAGGKNTAGKILARIGLILGIIFTSIWGLYFLIFIELLSGM